MLSTLKGALASPTPERTLSFSFWSQEGGVGKVEKGLFIETPEGLVSGAQ